MKIEIAESLIFSWLRHVQGCVVTQMNWKPSPSWTIPRAHELAQEFERIRAFAYQAVDVPIFKQADFGQFVRQTEIDALGLRWDDGSGVASIIAVDSAFHENGLQYGNADETIGRVIKKLVRGALALDAYFGGAEISIVFATPKMAEPIQKGIQRHLETLGPILASRAATSGRRLRFRVIANEDFAEEILRPVLAQVDAVADTSELFLRAQQLMRVCDSGHSLPSAGSRADSATGEPNNGSGKIGTHVRSTMEQLAATGRLAPDVVGELISARYCKARFKLAHPFLKAVDGAVDLSNQRKDENGYGRYWKNPLEIGGIRFLMCSQWFDFQRGIFDAWVRDLG